MISVIICSADPVKFANAVATYNRALAGEAFEIVGIHDARGMAEGYNHGVARSRGELLLFSHDDVVPLAADFSRRFVDHLRHFDLIGVAGASKVYSGKWIISGPPYIYGQVVSPNPVKRSLQVIIWNNAARRVAGVKALDGVLLGTRREVAETVRFDAESFGGFHLYDVDFTFRAHLAGYRLAVCCDLAILHNSHGNFFEENFRRDDQLFKAKHAGKLDQVALRKFQVTAVDVSSTMEALEIMVPPHWAGS
jgi:GT2 family glycosyltransferase